MIRGWQNIKTNYQIMIKQTVKFVLIGLVLPTVSVLNAQTDSQWFTANELYANVWQISDHGADNIYLVEGRDSSLLIDTGLGGADLASYIRKLTSKPLIVLNTHGHPDHAGSNYQFEKVYMHSADTLAARQCNSPEAREGSSKTMLQGNIPSGKELFRGRPIHTKLIPVPDGYVFNLGNRRMQVIEAPGHTPGEICILDVENKLLFSGDNDNTLVWLFLQNSKPLHEYLITLEKLAGRLSEFNTILPGHGGPLPSDFILDQVKCVKGILDKSLESKPYKSFAGNSMISTFGRASVAFNPDNL